jgi:hypothetical protein
MEKVLESLMKEMTTCVEKTILEDSPEWSEKFYELFNYAKEICPPEQSEQFEINFELFQ